MKKTGMTVFDLQNQYRQLTEPEIKSLSTVTALGTFDGVHIGHAALLRKAAEQAAVIGASPAVWTFLDPPFHGRSKILMTLHDKLACFASFGIRYAFLEDFSAVRETDPAAFVSDILLQKCGVRGAVCGFNFRFGHAASGTPALLSELLAAAGAALTVIPAVTLDGTAVSSTRIRSLLASGDTEHAARCLGRYYSVCLPVVHGKELGRKIGVPTINQNFPPELQTPMRSTYAAAVLIDGSYYPGVTNVGIRPSISENDDHVPNAETHIIGYHGWLYDKPIRVFFRRRLRDEMKFSSLDALKEQIACDIRASVSTFDKCKEFCQ